jgi:hypothetical protein
MAAYGSQILYLFNNFWQGLVLWVFTACSQKWNRGNKSSTPIIMARPILGGTAQARRTTQDLWSPCQNRERNRQSEKVSLPEKSDWTTLAKEGEEGKHRILFPQTQRRGQWLYLEIAARKDSDGCRCIVHRTADSPQACRRGQPGWGAVLKSSGYCFWGDVDGFASRLGGAL